jgi:DNA recombination protein RmuC
MGGTGTVLLAGLIALIVLGAIGLAFLSARSREAAAAATSRLDRLLAETGRAREAAQAVDRRFDELRRSVDGRVEGIEVRLAAGQQSVADHLGKSTHLMKELGERLGRLQEASQKIEKLAGDVTRLEDLLKPPKLRGTLGEMFLEQALAQVLPPGAYAMQHPLAGGGIVDAVVFVQDRLVPVDSKFPLENYRRAREHAEEGERRRARQLFSRDVRRHVDSIAEKYIRPGSGTCDFAFMYVPAEAVYAEIVGDEEDGSLADYASSHRVIPVSPRLLYAYLSTVALGLRGLELQENARQVQQNLAELTGCWDRVSGPLEKLGVHLGNAHKQFEETSKAVDRFAARLESIADKADEKLDSAGGAPLSLPPS